MPSRFLEAFEHRLNPFQMYTDYGMEEYPESSIFQMIGRAGRPQFDTFGVAVIMTQRDNVVSYWKVPLYI